MILIVSEGKSKTPTCIESINANFFKHDKMIFNSFKYQNDIIDNDYTTVCM